jgi:hypothetical protein
LPQRDNRYHPKVFQRYNPGLFGIGWKCKKTVRHVVGLVMFPQQMKTSPTMNFKFRHFSAVAIALLVCSCAGTSLKKSWKSADFHGGQFKKIAVLTVDDRSEVRVILEGQLATQLEARGQAALRVNELMTVAEIKESKERAAERLRLAGADAILIQRLIGRESVGRGATKAGAPATPSFSSGSLGWFDYYCIVIPAPTIGSADLTQDFDIESSLHDLASEKRVWSCVTQTTVKENTDRLELVKPLTATIVQAMVKDGVIR